MKLGSDKLFDALCVANGIPPSVKEHLFAKESGRKWRFDHAWLDAKLALEVQGGLFRGGRHVRGAALLKEHEKLNAAAILGWRILYCSPRELETGDIFATIMAALA